jgi:hypothetical protein
MTYEQAIALVKTSMKYGQSIGVEWDANEETFQLVIGDTKNGTVRTADFIVALATVATERVR